MLLILSQSIRWLIIWIYFVFMICLLGALFGTLLHLFFGFCFIKEPDYWHLGRFGFFNGIRYGGVWSGGLSIVLCVILARKEYLQRQV